MSMQPTLDAMHSKLTRLARENQVEADLLMEQLVTWVQGMRKDGVPVTYSMLRIMVLDAAVDLGLNDDGFNTRHALVKQVVLDDDLDVVYNVDETAVNYEYLTTKSLNQRGESTVWVKTKVNMTAMLLTDSSGKEHPLFLVLRSTSSKVKAVVHLAMRKTSGRASHFTVEVVSYANELNVILERVLPNCTWICQPADVAWNRPLKARLRQIGWT
ncbi:hypothetical protein H257_06876 [Aphanomyces astaci]|uniref:Uncharacterized protein n=1 Tax=Aphanomyces astaci TaxID=112090 RepID=W4GJW8_APHAT|nr:hypothetical protein H257_06876 [Aphanomyces astaci]ETV79616.1 hypothetical protein H257_06876 [Aphanomyces astaci]|eukprot:XP_009830552.1 hypothetical protein H257_06876 [Aphanomyces astaci]